MSRTRIDLFNGNAHADPLPAVGYTTLGAVPTPALCDCDAPLITAAERDRERCDDCEDTARARWDAAAARRTKAGR
jgi:hypothetical protein